MADESRKVLDLRDEEETYAEPIDALVQRLAVAHALGKPTDRILDRLANTYAQEQTIADLAGRSALFAEIERDLERVKPGDPVPLLFAVPRVPFLEAIRDIIERAPPLARPTLSSSWRDVAARYRAGAFDLARTTSTQILQRVQRAVARGIAEGVPLERAEQVIGAIGDWSRAYSETVYRTNLNSAYTAGRFEQAQDPNVRKVIGAFEFLAVLDGDQRENHAAAHGLLAAVNDPIWRTFAPPLGFNCRCRLRTVKRTELERRGLVRGDGQTERVIPATFSAAAPDPGFSGGRDSRIPG